MNDCPNADVRDLLPDLVHQRLDAPARVMVESHVATCADCRSEVDLLRDLRASLRRTPKLDLATIVTSVPAYRAPVRRTWVGWRTAAAITVIVTGASSLMLREQNVTPRSDSLGVGPRAESVVVPAVSVPVPATPAPRSGESVAASMVAPAVQYPPAPKQQPVATAAAPLAPIQVAKGSPNQGRELAMAGGTLSDLSDRELAALLKDIEKLDLVPSTDVESGALSPVTPRRSAP